MDKKSSKISGGFWASVKKLDPLQGIFDGFASIIYIRYRMRNLTMCVDILDTCYIIKFFNRYDDLKGIFRQIVNDVLITFILHKNLQWQIREALSERHKISRG